MATLKQKVSLEGLRFYSYHGYYPEEQILGSEYIMDIHTELEVFGSGEDEISNTINYERLFQIASAEMKIPRKLMETVVHDILEQIRHEFLTVQSIRIALRKLNPPLGSEVKHSGVELIFNR